MINHDRFQKLRLTFIFLILFSFWPGCQTGRLNPEARTSPEPDVLGTFSYTVSMDRPSSGRLQVVFNYANVTEEEVELKMPVWSPGYYRILNFGRHVENFRAADERGRSLPWERRNENTWRIKSGAARDIKVSYEVVAQGQSVAESQLDVNRAYISPTSLFMFVPGKLDYPVQVTVKPYAGFSRISTGLEQVSGVPNTFYAENFDVLYDCPIYVGNQKVITFEVSGIPHELVVDGDKEFNEPEIISSLKRMIMTTTGVVGEIPYRRYVFIVMGPGRGGLEHRNSMAVFGGIPRGENRRTFQNWLSFIAHEFFHLYNVKAIRPVALGPFDYEKENRTNMLWFSEGGTVYYEYLILKRAGFMTREEFLEAMGRIVGKVENSAGRKLESAAEASYRAWEEPFFGSETTISYYDIGAILTMLLDLKIRHETGGEKNLDHLMKLLYRRYYREQKRGFTDEEFRAACEEIAGADLSEFFNYVYTTQPIDYDRYLGYAGLKLEVREGENGRRRYSISIKEEIDGQQLRVLTGWL